jgi:hypothetical protein
LEIGSDDAPHINMWQAENMMPLFIHKAAEVEYLLLSGQTVHIN